jgi:hypothetical protein
MAMFSSIKLKFREYNSAIRGGEYNLGSDDKAAYTTSNCPDDRKPKTTNEFLCSNHKLLSIG